MASTRSRKPEARTGLQIGSADAVIGDLDVQLIGFPGDVHRRLGGVCVAGDVRERFRDEVVDGRCDGLGRGLVELDVEIDRDG